MKRSEMNGKILNSMYLVLPSYSVNEGIARGAVAAFCAQLNPTASELGDIKCALSEAVTNSIVHAYEDGIGTITVLAQLKDNVVTIEIKDEYVMYVLSKTIKEKALAKYLQHEIKSSSHIYYNLENEYLFKPKPSTRNNEGLDPLSFSSITNRLFRLTNLIGLTTQEVYQYGLCYIINNYQNEHNKKLSMNEINFYLKDVLKIPSVYSQEIYNLINKEKDTAN